MTAHLLITRTVTQSRLTQDGNEVETRYFDNVNEAIDYVETRASRIEFEELDI